jgi:hypothetical protein
LLIFEVSRGVARYFKCAYQQKQLIMKTTIVVALLTLISFGGYAQNHPDAKAPELKNNGAAVFVRPNFDRPFKVLFNPPCMEYKRHGLVVMECPGIMMAPENGEYDKAMYTGYGTSCAPQMAAPTSYNTKKEIEDRESLSKK